MKIQKPDGCLRQVLQKDTTEQLDALLQAELRKEDPSEALVLAIMDILREREAEQSAAFTDTVLTSWDHFKDHCEEDRQAEKKAAVRSCLTKTLAGVIAACLLIVTIPRVFGAENIFQLIAQWTDSEFSFTDENKEPECFVYKTEHPGLQKIYDAVTELGITDPVVPMWVPDGFELTEFDILEQASFKRIYALLTSGEEEILLTVNLFTETQSRYYLKDESCIKQYERGGVIHYIVSNDGEWKAIWTQDNCECSISTNCQEKLLYEILASIY